MRSSFGRFAMELRAKRGLSQTAFAEKLGESLSRISNIEFQRASVSDDMIGRYIAALNCTGEEAFELRKRANFSNSIKRSVQDGVKYPPLLAMFEQFSDRLSPKAAAEIQRILERESGEQIEILAYSSNKAPLQKRLARGTPQRPSLMPRRFAEICILAYELRQKICPETAHLKIEEALEKLSLAFETLDYAVVDSLPSYLEGAFACILGEIDGSTILIEQKRYKSAVNGVHFARHVLAHEIGHYILHRQLLKSNGVVILPPQELAKNSSDMINSDKQIFAVANTIVEVEAELFATMFLVPWRAFFKGTEVKYLASDFGEQLEEVKRYSWYFKNPAVIDAFNAALWSRGERI